MAVCALSLNSAARLIVPVESSDSQRLIGRIFILAKRPVPVCHISSVFAGTAEPVRMKNPSPSRWSTSKRMVSHRLGASCHSSISFGVSPSRRVCGLIFASCIYMLLFLGSFMYITLFAFCSAEVVLPHHFGPSISTAPMPSRFLSSKVSAIRFLYLFVITCRLCCKNSINN